MSAQDNIDEANAEAKAFSLAAVIALAILRSCANTSKNIKQDKSFEKIPVKIEYRESITTNQIYTVSHPCLIHLR